MASGPARLRAESQSLSPSLRTSICPSPCLSSDEVVITTKAFFPTGAGANDRGASRYHLERAVEASLRRLATDRIDVFYVHRFDDNGRDNFIGALRDPEPVEVGAGGLLRIGRS